MRVTRLLTLFSLALLGGCTRSSGALPASGRDLGPSADSGPPGADLSRGCDGLDETSCKSRLGCVADYCMECACSPAYVGCRATERPHLACPALGCAEPRCCGNGQACGGNQVCLAPGVRNGGACGCGPSCQVDGDCALQGQSLVCDVATSLPGGCCPGLTCVSACTTDSQCLEGYVCDPDHHCRAQTCSSDGDCGPNFVCPPTGGKGPAHCQRKPCALAADCPLGYCVEGACYGSLGTCGYPAP
jgi:hypothetical protein